jgi:hypothetical protein
MTKRFQRLTCTPTSKTMALALLISLVLSNPLVAADQHSQHHSAQQAPPSSKLVQLVRQATKQYTDVNNAVAAGYGPFLGCVTGSDHGAMGVHYVNLTLYGSDVLDVTQPEAVIYEPQAGGRLRLVGVEYIIDATTWLANNNNTPPVLEGQVFQYVGSPNRFNIPSFFELHVWAWRDNPQGAFVDWNNQVTCENQ